MQLKDYQQRVLEQVKRYLQSLDAERDKDRKSREAELGPRDWPAEAWKQLQLTKSYHSRQNGLGDELPNFVLKIPTGGGKTLLAVKAVDLINEHFTKRRTGLVTWIVPTTQIYQQTLRNLRNRDHPYRQHLDMASAGRTIIVEKTDRFTPTDVAENLVILILMLPSAARAQDKQIQLRFFRDNGGFEAFFPTEEQYAKHEELLAVYPNLDTFGTSNGIFGQQVKTSLGNVLRILKPVVIVDESQKGKSPISRDTLRNLNPSIVVELSATPPQDSNELVNISGLELEREEMIKLDLHVAIKASPNWQDTLLATIEKRNLLEEKANEYHSRTGQYIRPIALIQTERTGKEQRDGKHIHAEDVRDYLVKTAGIPAEHIKVQTSETKELEADPQELMSANSQTRYIITKNALQEGWDCAFAYVLAILVNPSSKTALTQLVGRILRQPYARKTGVKDLDESYVFAFQHKAAELLNEIKRGFEDEGLGDLARAITTDETMENGEVQHPPRVAEIRDKFRKFAGRIYLPVFVTNCNGHWQRVNYEMDVLSKIDWSKINLEPLFSLTLSEVEDRRLDVDVKLIEDWKGLIEGTVEGRIKEAGLVLDPVFIARHLLEVVSNPWLAYAITAQVLEQLSQRYNENLLTVNTTFIIEAMRNHLEHERDRLAEEIFRNALKSGAIRFLIVRDEEGIRLPEKLEYTYSTQWLTRADGDQLQLSLFDRISRQEFNDLERSVAWYLEDQAQLFWWYRNRSRQDYQIQGWKKDRVYADFIFSTKDDQDPDGFDTIYIVETKGQHLMGNMDTNYKKELFDLCNQLAQEVSWNALGLDLPEKQLKFELVPEDTWKTKLNELLK